MTTFANETIAERAARIVEMRREAMEPAMAAAVMMGWNPDRDTRLEIHDVLGLNSRHVLVVNGVSVWEVVTKLSRREAEQPPTLTITPKRLARMPVPASTPP